MLDAKTKTRIDSARDILVGKVPDPKSQVEKITIALSYKFMDDMDHQSRNWAARRRSSPATSRSTVGLHQQGLGGGATQMTTKNQEPGSRNQGPLRQGSSEKWINWLKRFQNSRNNSIFKSAP